MFLDQISIHCTLGWKGGVLALQGACEGVCGCVSLFLLFMNIQGNSIQVCFCVEMRLFMNMLPFVSLCFLFVGMVWLCLWHVSFCCSFRVYFLFMRSHTKKNNTNKRKPQTHFPKEKLVEIRFPIHIVQFSGICMNRLCLWSV